MGKISNNETFIIKARKIHGEKYNYSKINYVGIQSKIVIICPTHGEFLQIPDNHLYRKNGCPECSNTTKISFEKFIEISNTIHNKKYRYSPIGYKSSRYKIEIICPIHGIFYQTPAMHMKGQGCPCCANIISKPETLWLDSLNVPDDCRQKRVVIGESYIKADAYVPYINTIYEFYGDYWHGNPMVYNLHQFNNSCKKTFGELYKSTQEKRILILEHGFNLIEIWEHDFNLASKKEKENGKTLTRKCCTSKTARG